MTLFSSTNGFKHTLTLLQPLILCSCHHYILILSLSSLIFYSAHKCMQEYFYKYFSGIAHTHFFFFFVFGWKKGMSGFVLSRLLEIEILLLNSWWLIHRQDFIDAGFGEKATNSSQWVEFFSLCVSLYHFFFFPSLLFLSFPKDWVSIHTIFFYFEECYSVTSVLECLRIIIGSKSCCFIYYSCPIFSHYTHNNTQF